MQVSPFRSSFFTLSLRRFLHSSLRRNLHFADQYQQACAATGPTKTLAGFATPTIAVAIGAGKRLIQGNGFRSAIGNLAGGFCGGFGHVLSSRFVTLSVIIAIVAV
jgi:hypothetical protein